MFHSANIEKIISNMDILLLPTDTKLIKTSNGVGNLAKFTSPLKLFDYSSFWKINNLLKFECIKRNNNNGKKLYNH